MRRWWIFAATTGSLSMILLDTTMVGVILPTVQRELDLSTAALQWVANAYLLTLAAFVAVGGRLADMFDPVRLFAAGVTGFALASAAAGIAPSGEALIAARAVQGVGAAVMMPASLAVVVAAFPPGERGRAVGLRAAISSAFLSIGPLIAGLLTAVASWRWVFWVNLPVSAATLVAARLAHTERIKPTGARFDTGGLLTLVPGLAAVVLALMEATTWGWRSGATIALLVCGGALLVAFAVHELRTRDPLVDLRLFRNRSFTADASVLFLVQFGLVGLTVFGAILLQDLLGFSPLEAGLAILPTTLAITVVAPAAGRLYDRLGARLPLAAGSAITAIGLLWTAAVVDRLSYAWLAPGYVAVGIGIGLTAGPANVDALGAAGPTQRGQAAGLTQLLRQVGGAVGLACIGTLVTTVQHARLSDFLTGAGVSPDRVAGLQRILAEDPTSQHAIAAQVPRADLTAVVGVARDAVVDAIATAYYVAGGVVLVALVVVLALRRRSETGPAVAHG